MNRAQLSEKPTAKDLETLCEETNRQAVMGHRL